VIEKMLKIRGIGLLHDALEQPVDFGRVTAIYGENGRGKSTISAILMSFSGGDATLLIGRKTIGGSHAPEVALLVEKRLHEFKNGGWSKCCPDVCVFDAAFVDANVYSGFDVSATHRRNLLDFALGEKGVKLKQKVDELTKKISAVTSEIRTQDARLAGICQPLAVQRYLALALDADIDNKIAQAEKAVEVASKAKEISERPKLLEVSMLKFDNSSMAGLLSLSLSEISAEAKKTVADHFDAHLRSHEEHWVREGLSLVKTNCCPFCGQTLEPAQKLMEAYGAYFDKKYKDFLQELGAVRHHIETILSDAQLASLIRTLGDNDKTGEFWKGLVNSQMPVSPADPIAEKTKVARAKILTLIESKLANPLAAIADLGELDVARGLTAEIESLLSKYNEHVRHLNLAIEAVQKQAKTSDLNAANASVGALKMQKKRHQSQNKEECEHYDALVEQKRKLEGEKVTAREDLQKYSTDLLGKYELVINRYLECFGAGFRIVDVGTSNEGGLPRVAYKLQLGSHKIPLGSPDLAQATPVFANTLSDGDKRTLAFSFFLARLVVDGRLSEQIVVLDDPVSSFDQSRRRATHNAVRAVTALVKQLILLSHDPVFIQSFSENDDVQKLGVRVLELRRAGSNYTVLDACDIEERVQSEYKMNYRTLDAYVTQGEVINKQKVVRAIRPMLEANLRHRFQDSLKGSYCLGKMIEAIRTSRPEEPLYGIRQKLKDLEDINDFATDFTHDSEADGSLQQLDDAQLKLYAERALKIARGT
jgi:wobble nucleotide-excising tRNase